MMGITPSIKTEIECVRYCVKERGGRFVQQIKGKVYRLDRQDLAEQNAGGRVKVTGARPHNGHHHGSDHGTGRRRFRPQGKPKE